MSWTSRLSSVARSVLGSAQTRRAAESLVRSAAEKLGGKQARDRDATGPTPTSPQRRDSGQEAPAPDQAADALADRGAKPPLDLVYVPVDDDLADPGEIVWAWVAFEEDISRGKDRPVLVIAREAASTGGGDGSGDVAIALMLTSHDRGTGVHTDEHGSTWVDIGTGAWDAQGRPSEVRADRLLRLPLSAVRRQGARLDQQRFDQVADVTARLHRWDR